MSPRWVWTLGTLAVMGVGLAGYAFSTGPNAPAAAPGMAGGESAPSLALPDLTGRTRTLDEWRGRVILLNFWASWCSPCMYEIDDLIRYQKEYAGRGLQILGIGVDAPRKLANVRRSLGIVYPVLVADPMSGILERWGDTRRMIPYSVLLDRRGRVVWRYRGLLNDEVFADKVLPLLAPGTSVAAD